MKYAQELQEAYHSRATQNRGWIYVAGILGLGVAAASGGLAAVTTVGAGTIGLLAISGGFASGTFATINNEALALSYTVAANSVDEALTNSRLKLVPDKESTKPLKADDNTKDCGTELTSYTADSCAAALPILIKGVSDARKHLEVARTDNAAGALARAKDQLTLMNKQIDALQEVDPSLLSVEAKIIGMQPLTPSDGATKVTLKVRAKLGQKIGIDDVKVAFGAKVLNVDTIAHPDKDDPITYEVTFTAPAKTDLSGTGKVFSPELILQGGTVRVKSMANLVFTYP